MDSSEFDTDEGGERGAIIGRDQDGGAEVLGGHEGLVYEEAGPREASL